MKNRVVQFDYIRVLACAGILLCHSLMESLEFVWLGKYFASTFNFLFLIISAFLLGAAWKDGGCQPYKFNFLSKRILKLSESYYPYLVILFVFLYITQDYFSIRKIITHFIYLPWFDKIGGFGHLWFMTMIVLCYIGCLLTTIIAGRKAQKYNILIFNTILAGGVILDYAVSSVGMPGYVFPYLIGYIMIFYYSKQLIAFVKSMTLPVNIVQFVVINLTGILLFATNTIEYNGFLSYFVGIVCGCSVFCLTFNLFSHVSQSGVVLWLSNISFEIYLVHEFFLGQFSVYKMIDNPVLGFLLFLVLSVVAALVLKQIASKWRLACDWLCKNI